MFPISETGLVELKYLKFFMLTMTHVGYVQTWLEWTSASCLDINRAQE